MQSTCTSAFGAMSWIAKKPSSRRTNLAGESPRAIAQKMQSSGSEDSFLGHRGRADADELARGQRARDEPGRVVVAVAAPGPVDEHGVHRADLVTPARERLLVREGAEAGAALLLRLRRNGVRRRRHRPW